MGKIAIKCNCKSKSNSLIQLDVKLFINSAFLHLLGSFYLDLARHHH